MNIVALEVTGSAWTTPVVCNSASNCRLESFANNLIITPYPTLTENPNIARLELMGGVRGQAAKNDVVFKTKLQDFKGLVCPKAVAY